MQNLAEAAEYMGVNVSDNRVSEQLQWTMTISETVHVIPPRNWQFVSYLKQARLKQVSYDLKTFDPGNLLKTCFPQWHEHSILSPKMYEIA